MMHQSAVVTLLTMYVTMHQSVVVALLTTPSETSQALLTTPSETNHQSVSV